MSGGIQSRQGPQRTLAGWFVDPDAGRLRAGWRILSFLLLFIGLSAAAQLTARAALGGLPRGSKLVFILLAITATAAVYLTRRFLDQKSFASLGFGRPETAWKDLSFGFALSGAMAACVFATMGALGLIENVTVTLSASGAIPVLAGPLLITILIGYWEELVFRGYLLQNLAEGLGMSTAIVVSCLLYGAVHAANPNAGVLSTLIIVLFGFLRIYGYLATGLLWLSIGMHIGWNFFQGPVFGFAASGHAAEQTLISHETRTPDWLSGGDFGPEASVLTVPVVLFALWAMRAWARRAHPAA